MIQGLRIAIKQIGREAVVRILLTERHRLAGNHGHPQLRLQWAMATLLAHEYLQDGRNGKEIRLGKDVPGGLRGFDARNSLPLDGSGQDAVQSWRVGQEE